MPNENDGDSEVTTEVQPTEETGEAIGANNEESPAEAETNIQPDGNSKAIEQELHRQALDLIGTVLSDDYKGDKKAFFVSHPELAEKANKSKKYKEEYRTLTASPKVEEPEEEEAVIDEEVLAERVYTKVTEKTTAEQRKAEAVAYAVKEGINKDDIATLLKGAEAIAKATGVSFAQSLEGAKLALKGSLKPKVPTKMPSGEGLSEEGANTKESEIERIMKVHGVDRKLAEKHVASKPNYDGGLGKWAAM